MPKPRPASKKIGKNHVGGNRRRDAARTREYGALMQKLGLTQVEAATLFEFASRTARRYKRGDGKVPISTLVLLKLMAQGKVTKQEILRTAESF